MRLAVVQVRDTPAEVPARTAHALSTLSRCAEAGADLALFPELYLGGYVLDQELALKAGQAEQAVGRLQAAVDELGVSAVLGLPLRSGAALVNAVTVLRPRTEPAFYAKTHLFRDEQDWFAAGGSLWVGEIAGWPCGLLVCYELGFPEIARCLALGGARLLLAPAAFASVREHVWRTATASRALENGCYLAAANTAGGHGQGAFLGGSCVVDPRGVLVATAGDDEELLVADLEAAAVDAARAGADGGHTYLRDRRPELFGEISRPSGD